MRLAMKIVLCIVLLPILGHGVWSYTQGWPANWREAKWSSAGIAPPAAETPEAVIQVYAARAGRWKGIFAVHTWIVVKPAGAHRYDRYEVVGWGTPVRQNAYNPDAYWYSNTPDVILDLRGREAAVLIPRIKTVIDNYPHQGRGTYRIWPGPNSNTFIAWIGRMVPQLRLEMPATAVGKDYLGDGLRFGATPSGTGYQFSLNGFLGVGLAFEEGLELHFLGTTIGIDPANLAVKFPGVGRIGIL